MHNSKLKQITVALCLALLPLSVFAAGLGKLNVNSGLGEPLKADIEILSVSADDLNSITAAIATDEAYTLQGIEKPASHNSIKIEIGKNASGAPILKLKSSQPISEPFLDMLIQVDWASGRLLREYTVLLDPPGYTADTANDPVTQNNQSPTVRSNNGGNDSALNSSNGVRKSQPRKKNKSAIKSQPEPQPAENADLQSDDNQTYTTQRGDSLAAIAQRLKPDNVNLDQMLVGLYQANPNAFDANNMNRLKVGKILRQPSEQELSAVTNQIAAKEVKTQAADWNAYRNKLAGIVSKAPAKNISVNAQSSSGKIKSAAEDQSTPASDGVKDVVKLSAGIPTNDKSAESTDLKALQAKITALQEENIAREKSIVDAQARTVALEQQIEDMQKLLTIKNGALGDMQNQAAKDIVAPAVKTEETKNTEIATSDKPKVADATPSKPIVVNPAVESKPNPVIEPESQSDILSTLDLPLLGSLAALLALLTGAWMFLRNKRKQNLASFEQGIMTSGGLKANTVFGNTSGSKVDTGDTSFLTDFSQSANGGMIDTNDVDPIAEAEVYMAYGRDAQAEEILKDAITKEPKRYELHLKLLEIYGSTKNFSAFEAIAGELYTSLGVDSPVWTKVTEIGIKLDPANPLYQASPSVASNKAEANFTNEKLGADDFSNVPIATETDLDFSFDNDSLVQNYAFNSGDQTPQSNINELSEPSKPSKPSELSELSEPSKQDDEIKQSSDIDFEPISSQPSLPTVETLEPNINLNATDGGDNSITESVKDDILDFDFGEFESKPDETVKASITSQLNNDDMQEINMSAFEITKIEDFTQNNTQNTVDDNTVESTDFVFDFDVKTQDSNSVIDSDSIEHVESNDLILSPESFDIPILDDDNDKNDSEKVSLDAIVDSDSFTSLEIKDANVVDEFSFNMDDVKVETESIEKLEPAKPFDFSEISLDLNDESVDQPNNFFENIDSVEIETKLSLVLAYIEMDDLEGAKEMLDEVMKEGSENQRVRAREIATKLA